MRDTLIKVMPDGINMFQPPLCFCGALGSDQYPVARQRYGSGKAVLVSDIVAQEYGNSM